MSYFVPLVGTPGVGTGITVIHDAGGLAMRVDQVVSVLVWDHSRDHGHADHGCTG